MDQKSQTTYEGLIGVYRGRTPEWCVVNRAKYLSTDMADGKSLLEESQLLTLETIALAAIIRTLTNARELNKSHEFNKQLSLQASLSGAVIS